MQGDRSVDPEERQAHSQFASDYAEKIRTTRAGFGTLAKPHEPSSESAVKTERAHDQRVSAPCVAARVVLIPSEALTYTVVMDRDGEESSRLSFGTMREAEAHVRQMMPNATPRSTLYDRDRGEV
jgi:hypothetical protein